MDGPPLRGVAGISPGFIAMEPNPLASLFRVSDERERLLLSHLLWTASHGPKAGRDPSARLHLFVALEAGCFAYDPRAHALRPHLLADVRLPRDRLRMPGGFDLACIARCDRTDAADPGIRRAVAAIDAAIVGARVEGFCRERGLGLAARGPLDARTLQDRLSLRAPRFVSFVQSIAWRDEIPARASSPWQPSS